LPYFTTFEALLTSARTLGECTKGGLFNSDFILGSAAEVERVWSIAEYILTKQCKRMTSYLFECLIFLRYNKEFWKCMDSQEAIQMVWMK
jgi:hypothetical protein